jgi:hypothetical protein
MADLSQVGREAEGVPEQENVPPANDTRLALGCDFLEALRALQEGRIVSIAAK